MNSKKILMTVAATAALFAAGASAAVAGATIAVIGGKTDDAFFAKVKKGIDDGALVAKAHGSTVSYLQLQTYDNIGGDAANLVRTAISQKATVIAVPDWVPDSEDEAIKAAQAAGIPVILFNAGGGDKAKELGAINYVGNEEYPAGVAGGEHFTATGSKNVICVNTVPGAQNLEDRCKGIADGIAKGGGKSTQLPLPASSFGNPTAVAEAIKATLLKDKTIDGVAAISAADADSAAAGIEQAGGTGKILLGSFDMNEAGLERIKAGTQSYAIDQQPWLQGFLAVTLADGFVNYGLKLASAPILTGPGVVDKTTIDATLAGAKAGYR
ncbi:substrate-binding domain-containing protein [Aestuariivirga litoralis]|uniref:substrate-binding domain-containing protein n=1 Tax=Aestuariivirga litoralis TaxID=2650924 RepID=UPI0018C63567|nr:substrate-binding domain-containing protein [Aestuariivirga litoralis]MBG1233508.1 substrate-binding domain-containing protein [Aestuariivirga litoralis]